MDTARRFKTQCFIDIKRNFEVEHLNFIDCDNKHHIRNVIQDEDATSLVIAISQYYRDIKHANMDGYNFVYITYNLLQGVIDEYNRLNLHHPFGINIPKLTRLNKRKCEYADKFRNNAMTNEFFNIMNNDATEQMIRNYALPLTSVL